MSDLYITEPPTTGKVILETNYGNIDIELFTRETPKSCKNFIQHCLNKYYNGCIFFKIFKNFMIQTGDPTNTGNGGESIFSEDFRDEFHSRLKFSHRGIVAMANKNKPNSNGSQFFITLDKCEEMDKKFTIFGKVTGPTFFNAVNISNLSADEDGHPIMNDNEKPKILNTEVVINPFSELKPTVIIENETKENEKKGKENKKIKKLKIKYTIDKMFFKDEDEDEEINENNKNKNKMQEEKNDNNNNNKDNNQKNESKKQNDKKNENNIEEKNVDKKENENIKNDVSGNNEVNKNILNDKKESNNNIKEINNSKTKNENDIDNINKENKNDKDENEKNKKIEQKEDEENKKDMNEKEDNEENEEDENENKEDSKSESSESESKSLSSDDNIVQNAKQLLDDDEDNIPKNKKKNIDDYKKEINLLRKKIKREKEEQYNEDELRKKIEDEKINKMNILQKYNYDYVKSKQANKLSTDERANKLKNFKSYIGGGESDGWYKTKLKFQTDSQKAFTLDMINKELENNEN